MQQLHLALVLHAARQGGRNFVQWEVDGGWEMAGVEFTGAAHVNHQRAVFQMRPRLFGRNLARPFEQKIHDYHAGNN